MMASPLAFVILASIVVFAAWLTVRLQNLFQAGLSLITCFAAVAGIYILLEAHFLAAVQIIIYVGAISVLMLFAIMLTQRQESREVATSVTRTVGASILASMFALMGTVVILGTRQFRGATGDHPMPGIQDLAEAMLNPNKFLLAFELVGILLLVVLVGASIIARKEGE